MNARTNRSSAAKPLPPRDDGKQPWDRLDDETDKAYSAFCCYRGLDPRNRSMYSAYKLYLSKCNTGGKPAHRTPTYMTQWSVRYRWVARAIAWDDHLDRERRLAQKEEVREIARRQVRQFATLQGVAMKELVRRAQTDDGFAGENLGALTYALSTGARCELAALGIKEDEKPAVMQMELPGIDEMSADELAVMSALWMRAAGEDPEAAGLPSVKRLTAGSPPEEEELKVVEGEIVEEEE